MPVDRLAKEPPGWCYDSYRIVDRDSMPMSFLKQLLVFLKQEKKWWLIPFAVLLVLGVIAVLLLASSSGISWALYPSK
jgi:hypothetical protein